MVGKLIPAINKVYFINQYTLIHTLSGKGGIQVDFKNYFDWQDKAIFLEKGQYIKFLSDDFVVRKIEFPNETKFVKDEVRVLFKHLISLGLYCPPLKWGNIYILRSISAIANFIYILYGILINAIPIIIGCTIAVALHTYRLNKLKTKKYG